ncbi:MAG: NAD(P)/FAD-dependent oxidoreductase [Saprospiraceae bacterium]
MKVAIIGGGAAGFFAALSVKEHHPDAAVFIIEKSTKLLSKVKISGGGRCNVTNGTTSIKDLSTAYPRGEKKLKKAFRIFNTVHTMDWFQSRGVRLMTQEDNCVFPVAQDSQVIIDCFLKEARKKGIVIQTGKGVKEIKPTDNQLQLSYNKDHKEETFDKVIVATGGSPKRSGLLWLEELGHKIEEPVPSLFTFNMPSESVRELMGIVVEKTLVSIQGTKLKSDGPLLITHWGMSGPAILKLSAFGARILSEINYECKAQVNWVNIQNNETVLLELKSIANEHGQKILANYRPYLLPDRLWQYLLEKSDLSPRKKWSELGKKGLNKLMTVLTNDVYQVKGKTTFKEEFVTCGGVSLESVDFKTMESRVVEGLYFAGEVMDVDGITGGYNFQSAWTTGFIAGKLS